MRKKIDVQALRPGMFLDELCGSWIDHPFWKARFVLRDEADVQAIRSSAITHCWIDVSKGLDVQAASVVAAVATAPAEARPVRSAEPAPVPLEDEINRAVAICARSRDAVLAMFQQARMGSAIDTERCLPLVEDISASITRNPGALINLARLKTHDDCTYMHSVAVCGLMIALARQLGMDEAATREAGVAGMLQDLGKAVMPIEILNKPGRLTPAEFAVMQTHPVRGHALLAEGGMASAVTLDACLHHHERVDGSGYPHQLSGEQISVFAKMGALCDVYDAVTSNRPYRVAWDPAVAISSLAEAAAKRQFDEAVFQAFVKTVGIYPTGSLVRLASGRLAVVVEQGRRSLVLPRVKAFFSTRSQMHIPPEAIDLAAAGCKERIVGREPNDRWQFKHLDTLWLGREIKPSKWPSS